MLFNFSDAFSKIICPSPFQMMFSCSAKLCLRSEPPSPDRSSPWGRASGKLGRLVDSYLLGTEQGCVRLHPLIGVRRRCTASKKTQRFRCCCKANVIDTELWRARERERELMYAAMETLRFICGSVSWASRSSSWRRSRASTACSCRPCRGSGDAPGGERRCSSTCDHGTARGV